MRAPSRAWLFVALAIGCGGGDDGDGGNPGGDPDAAVAADPTAYRVTTLELKDPHVFALGDNTGLINDEIADATDLDGDNPPDGMLDLNIVIVHRPLRQNAASTAGEVSFPDCTGPPILTTECTLAADGQFAATTMTNSDAVCLDVVADTTSGFQPPVVPTQPPCFSTEAETLTVDLGGTMIPLIDAQLAGRYVNDPADQIDSGLIRGFLTQAAADSAIISEDVLLVGGDPVSSVLRDQDKDVGPSGEDGWWFYLNYTAREVPYTTN